MKSFGVIVFIVLGLASSAQAQSGSGLPAGTYTLDKSHASLVFSVSHIGFTSYTMSFDSFDARLEFDPVNLEQSSVKARVNPMSLDLPTPPEGFADTIVNDGHWLNARIFPAITFTSQRVELVGEQTVRVHGTLALLGVKKPVVLNAVFNGGYRGHAMDPHARIGFSATGTFKRSDFGMIYGLPEPGSTMGVGDEISVVIEAEFSGPPLRD